MFLLSLSLSLSTYVYTISLAPILYIYSSFLFSCCCYYCCCWLLSLLSLFSSCRRLYTLHHQIDTHTFIYVYVAENIDRKTHRHEKGKKVNKKKKGQKVVDAARRSWTMYVLARVYERKNERSAEQIHTYSKCRAFVGISFKVSLASILIIDLQAI
jgi:hypothetical protein